jgi:hypothetical protein
LVFDHPLVPPRRCPSPLKELKTMLVVRLVQHMLRNHTQQLKEKDGQTKAIRQLVSLVKLRRTLTIFCI